MVEMRIKNKKRNLAQNIRPSLGVALAAVAYALGALSSAACAEPAKSAGPLTGATPLATRSWTVQELLPPQSLNATKNESVTGWSERHATGVMKKMTSSQSGKNQALKGFFDRQGVVSEQDQKLRLAALKDVKQPEFREKRDLSRYLLNQLGKALGDHARYARRVAAEFSGELVGDELYFLDRLDREAARPELRRALQRQPLREVVGAIDVGAEVP
ncbi:MAG: hypothetical protein EBU49_05415, partial [Proteobacteria bacterium]|nr:hypothetical protein [Pseudomonadota bacterium]